MVLERPRVAQRPYGNTKQPVFHRPQPRQAPAAKDDDMDIIELIDVAHAPHTERRAPWEVTVEEMRQAVAQSMEERRAGLGVTTEELLKRHPQWL
jgi:hypothetical protein